MAMQYLERELGNTGDPLDMERAWNIASMLRERGQDVSLPVEFSINKGTELQEKYDFIPKPEWLSLEVSGPATEDLPINLKMMLAYILRDKGLPVRIGRVRRFADNGQYFRNIGYYVNIALAKEGLTTFDRVLGTPECQTLTKAVRGIPDAKVAKTCQWSLEIKRQVLAFAFEMRSKIALRFSSSFSFSDSEHGAESHKLFMSALKDIDNAKGMLDGIGPLKRSDIRLLLVEVVDKVLVQSSES